MDRNISVFNITVSCCSGNESLCVCGYNEKVLRAYSEGRCKIPMTTEQREWCLDEAERAGEGSYPRSEGIGMDDAALAERVINAWHDYVQSNCL